MSKEAKVVELIRRLSKAIDDAPGDIRAIEAAAANLETGHEAAEKYDLGELARAASLQYTLSSTTEREIIFDHYPDPLEFLQEAEALIKKYEKHLR
jgi:hypothetical protein